MRTHEVAKSLHGDSKETVDGDDRVSRDADIWSATPIDSRVAAQLDLGPVSLHSRPLGRWQGHRPPAQTRAKIRRRSTAARAL